MTSSPFVEIIGLNESSHGRNCERHACCGSQIAPCDLIRFKLCFVGNMNNLEKAIKAVIFRNGAEWCTIGFLPKFLMGQSERFLNKFAEIQDLYDESENSAQRAYSRRNNGVAGAMLLNEVPEFE